MPQQGTCPVCNGSGRIPVEPSQERWKKIMASYDEATDTFACRNCGGQTMNCHGTGQVNLRADGSPCVHEYQGVNAGRCYTVYTCVHCGDRYGIDSGD